MGGTAQRRSERANKTFGCGGLLAAICLIGAGITRAGVILPTPHDDCHVVAVAPSDFVDEKGAPVHPVPELAGAFDQTTHALAAPLSAELRIRHVGRYTLWVRIGQPRGKPMPVKVTLVRKGGTVLDGVVNHDGSGQAARLAYIELAKKNTPPGAVPTLEPKQFAGTPDKPSAPSGDDLTGELLRELREKPSDPWTSLTRVEEMSDELPFYWWKCGAVELSPGRYELRIGPASPATVIGAAMPRFDAAMLTTNEKLVYPFANDIGRSRAIYVRFRLDQLPKSGIRIAGAFSTHILQYLRLSGTFGSDGLNKETPHTQTGLTCWYRLQDIKNMPPPSAWEIGIRLSITDVRSPLKPAADYAGATQFASFPHADFVVREFDWLEPTGLNYTVPTDCQTYQHRLMTFRDHAREHYQTALSYTNCLNPLTRGDLFFTGICGALNADDRDYMLKTIRLMGFNSVSEIGDPRPARQLYGWAGAQFAARLPLPFIVDEDQAREKYEEHFRKFFADPKTRDVWQDVKSYCMTDEPGEAYRTQMTAPVWQFREDQGTEYCYDPVGGSALITRHDNLGDCVVEGVIQRLGPDIQFQVGVDDQNPPAHYWYWRMGGIMGPALNANFCSGEYVVGQVAQPRYRMVQSLATAVGKIRFKIVHQAGAATLFINGHTIHQHLNLPKNARFGIAGGIKRIDQLRLRPLFPGEGMNLQEGALQDAPKQTQDLGLEELNLANLPAWAKPKTVRRAVEEDWIEVGGDPTVTEAFRRWARTQHLTPAMFGKKDWQHVRPLTLPSLVQNEDEARLFYWSRRFSGQLTPLQFTTISDAIAKFAPNPRMWNYPALSGGQLYYSKEMPVDMFELGSHGNHHTGGISDWMFYSTWRWDSHQAVAFSVELFNAGARRHGGQPVSFPMMHCVSPTVFRAYTQIANQVKILSCYDYGPRYFDMPDSWSESPGCYDAVSQTANRAALCDDILAPGLRRPSRVALLYAHSSEYWNPKDSFDDKRSTFLGLSHEYYQPEIVSEQQVTAGALKYYDALYVLEPHVAADAQKQIAQWVQGGGLLWSCADALSRDEYNRPVDVLAELAQLRRTFSAADEPAAKGPLVEPVPGIVPFRRHTVVPTGMPLSVEYSDSRVMARYDHGGPAWLEKNVGQGKVVYVGHRAGSTYSSRNVLSNGYKAVWADTGRELLTHPLHAAGIERQLVLSEPTIMATATSTNAGTVIILYNMRPNPRPELVVRLREPKAPLSVETFESLSLKSVPFEYQDGWLSVRLKDFDEGQMIVVRTQPKPADDRLDQMRLRTVAQLASSEPDVLSAGAWFAGFFPSWHCTDKIIPLLDHPSWAVRRAAAEALGKLGDTAARDRLFAATASETDAHVLAEEIFALTRLRHPDAPELCRAQLNHRNFLVRQHAMRGLASYLPAGGQPPQEIEDALRGVLLKGAETGLGDGDHRARREAIRILGQLDPQRALAEAREAFAVRDAASKIDRPQWAAALASGDGSSCDAALADWAAGRPGSDALLCSLAMHRQDPKLAAALVGIARTRTKETLSDWVAAMLRQRNQDAARELFAERASLPEGVRSYLPLICEHTFDASLGNSDKDWENFFASR